MPVRADEEPLMHPTAVLIDRFRRTYLKVKEGPRHIHVVPMAGSRVMKLTPQDCEALALRELDYPLERALVHFQAAAERFGMTAELGALLTRRPEDAGPPGEGGPPSAPPVSEGRERPVKGQRAARRIPSEAEQFPLKGLGTAAPSRPKERAPEVAKGEAARRRNPGCASEGHGHGEGR
jgi:hypothetical protein